MPVIYDLDENGRPVRRGKLGSGQYVPPAKPAPKKKPKRVRKPWWQQWANHVEYELKRAAETGAAMARDPVGHIRDVVLPGLTSRDNLRVLSGTGLSRAPAVQAATAPGKAVILGTGSAANNAIRNTIELTQPEGRRDYSQTALGSSIDRLEDAAYRGLGFTPPIEMTPAEQSAKELGSSIALNAALAIGGGAALSRVAGIRRVTAALNPARAKTVWGGIGRAMVAESLAEIPSTFLDDNQGGSAASFVSMIPGINIEDPVKPGMDRVQASQAAFGPNLMLATGVAGAGALLSKLPDLARARKANRVIDEQTKARQSLENAGIQETDPETGAARFTDEVTGNKADTSVADADRAAREALGIEEEEPQTRMTQPAAPADPRDAALEEFGRADTRTRDQPFAEPAGPDEDPWAIDFDPTLPEADTVKKVLGDLDPDELRAVADARGQELEKIEEVVENRGPLEADPALRVALTGAPTNNLSTPLTPWGEQWANLSTDQLRSIASPTNSPELFDEIANITGRVWDEFTRADILEGLERLQGRGITVIPNRLKGDARTVPVGEIQVDPLRFQFKQGVNAQGQQRGNSLEGVGRWNTDMEGAIQVWTDPMDGRIYVVNGHNRLAKARELGVPTMRVEELLASTAEQARAMGALSNIAQGGGTVYDAAKFLRDSNITDPAQLDALGVPLSSGHGRQGLALARLPGNIFQAAIDGEVSLGKAVAMGESGLEEAALQQAWKTLRNTDMTDSVFREVLAQAGSAPVVQGKQVDLFGNTESLSLMRQKAELSVQVERLLRKKGKVFGDTAESAEDLAQVGNQIDVGATDEVAQRARLVLDGFRRDKYMAGTPISELLNQGAQQMADGAQVAPLARRISQQMLEASEGMKMPRNAGIAARGADIPSRAAGEPEARWKQLSPEKQEQFAETARKDLLTPRKRANREKKAAAVKEQEARHLEWMDDETALKQGQLSQEDYEAKWGPVDAEEPPVYKPKNAEYKPIEELERDESARRYLDWYERELETKQAAEMTSEMRESLENEVISNLAREGKIRPGTTPIPPRQPDPGVDLVKVADDLNEGRAPEELVDLADAEQALSDAHRVTDAQIEREQLKEARAAIGYDDLPFEAQKELGAADGFEVRVTRMEDPNEITGMAVQMARLTDALPSDLAPAIRARGVPSLEDLLPSGVDDALRRDLDAVLRGDMPPTGPRLEAAADALRAFWGVDPTPIPDAIAEPIGRQLPNGEWAFSAKDRNRVMNQFQVDPQALAKENRDQAIELVRQARQAEIERAGLEGKLRTPQQPFLLSAELAKSDPRYGGATLRFESDLDRAAYVLAADKRTKASKAAPKFRAELEAAGLDPDEIAKYGAEVKQRVKDTAKAKFGSAAANRAKGELFIAPGKGPGARGPAPEDAMFEFDSAGGWSEVGGGGWDAAPRYEDIPPGGLEVQYQGPMLNAKGLEARQQLIDTLQGEIRRIAGDEVDIEIFDGKVWTRRKAEWGGGKKVSRSLGWYSPMEDVVRVNEALTRPVEQVMQTAWHESFHRIQYNLLSNKEMEVMQNMAGGLRTIVGGKINANQQMALSELQAVAFQRYALARKLGQDPHQAIFREFGLPELAAAMAPEGLARPQSKAARAVLAAVDAAMPVLGRLYDLFERLTNAVQGRGWKSVQSIFEDAYQGRLYKRNADQFISMSDKAMNEQIMRMQRWRETMFSLDVERMTVERDMAQLRQTALENGC